MAHLTREHVQYLYDTFGELKVLDDIIRHRAADDPPVPILGYPRHEDRVDDYEQFTGLDLNRFVDAACEHYLASGLNIIEDEVVGILAASNLDFIVTFFALSRLGCPVLCLSLRIAPVAVVNLLNQTKCSKIVHGHSQQVESTILAVSREISIQMLHIPTRWIYDTPSLNGGCFVRQYDRESERDKIALIMHSSGSTGLPKPVFLSHRNVLCHPVQGAGLHNFGALPLYHMYGVSTMLQAMYMKKTANIFNAMLPLTADNLIASIEVVRPEVVHVVPYALGLLAEQPRGIAYLKACKTVTAAGARTPDELGDRLVKEGVNLGVVFGTTEAGLAGDTMRREKGDDSWNYVRFYSNVRQYVYMDPLGDHHYECVYLKGHPGLSTSNSDDGSWRSKDVFIRHPTIPDTWKYVTRLDDRITLLNGEKVLPLPIEGCIRESNLVREAVVVGIDRPVPGLLVFKSQLADGMPNDKYIDAIWPVVADANSRAEGFSQITKDMISVLASNTDYPHTDKGSIIRAQVYKIFADQIDEIYATLEDTQGGGLKLDLTEMEDFLRETYMQITGAPLASLETDFFTAGVDSLQAIQMRRIIQRTLDLKGHRLSRNVVYEHRNPSQLAHYLFSLSSGNETKVTNVNYPNSTTSINGVDKFGGSNGSTGNSNLISQLINKYSDFGQTVILTGATGSIGAHVLAQMVSSDRFNKVYCFVRGPKPMQRVLDSLEARCLTLDAGSKSKIVSLEYDVSSPHFGLGEAMMEKFRKEVTLILHIAWPVNFNIPLQTFEPHLAGLRNLLKLSVSVRRPRPAQLFFCSSIGTALNTPPPAAVPDAAIEDFRDASHTGYAQSKLVGEHMVLNAVRAGARSYVLRIGQVAGDTDNGVWNDTEFIPVMIRSALSMKMLPALHEECSWVAVDCLATTILELAETRDRADAGRPPLVFYNIVNPQTVSWDAVLAELKAAGLEFTKVPFGEWLRELRKSAARGEEKRNPAVKLMEYFGQHYASSLNMKDGGEGHGVSFQTIAAENDSAMMRTLPSPVEHQAIQKCLARWLRRWS